MKYAMKHTAAPAAILAFLSAVWLFIAPGCGVKTNSDETSAASLSQALSANPLSTAPLQLKVLTNSCGANQMQDFFEVINNGTTAVKLSDISIKFWANDTSGQNIVPHVWTGGCVTGVGGNPSCVHQVSGVTPTPTHFSPACGPDATHLANW